MEPWRAVRAGLLVRVFFPSLKPGAAAAGEYVVLKVTSVGDPAKPAPLNPNTEMVGLVVEPTTLDVGVKLGDSARVVISRVDEILP